jgi:hypothetical protein
VKVVAGGSRDALRGHIRSLRINEKRVTPLEPPGDDESLVLMFDRPTRERFLQLMSWDDLM